MVLGGIPILALSYWKQEPAVSGHLHDLSLVDWARLAYVAVFGSAVATGLFFYNATRGINWQTTKYVFSFQSSVSGYSPLRMMQEV